MRAMHRLCDLIFHIYWQQVSSVFDSPERLMQKQKAGTLTAIIQYGIHLNRVFSLSLRENRAFSVLGFFLECPPSSVLTRSRTLSDTFLSQIKIALSVVLDLG